MNISAAKTYIELLGLSRSIQMARKSLNFRKDALTEFISACEEITYKTPKQVK